VGWGGGFNIFSPLLSRLIAVPALARAPRRLLAVSHKTLDAK
jgi:hypothetical protein